MNNLFIFFSSLVFLILSNSLCGQNLSYVHDGEMYEISISKNELAEIYLVDRKWVGKAEKGSSEQNYWNLHFFATDITSDESFVSLDLTKSRFIFIPFDPELNTTYNFNRLHNKPELIINLDKRNDSVQDPRGSYYIYNCRMNNSEIGGCSSIFNGGVVRCIPDGHSCTVGCRGYSILAGRKVNSGGVFLQIDGYDYAQNIVVKE